MPSLAFHNLNDASASEFNPLGEDLANGVELAQAVSLCQDPFPVHEQSRNSHRPPAERTHKYTVRCWEHGCGGRLFSTKSNLARHQREKAGTSPKSMCHKCGANFTRSTARDSHLATKSCNTIRRYSNGRIRKSQMRLLVSGCLDQAPASSLQ